MAKAYIPYNGPIVTRKEAKLKSLKRFFDGNPCHKGHISEKFVFNYSCCQCCADRPRKQVTTEQKIKYRETFAAKQRNRIRHPLTASRVREVFDYDQFTGVLKRNLCFGLSGRSNGKWAEKETGCLSSGGYLKVGLDGVQYPAHRIIFIWMLGAEPVGDIDHIDMDKLNNRWRNLRPASRSQNMFNTKAHKDSKSKLKWANYDSHNEMWRPQISINGKVYVFKRVATAQEAHDICAEYAAKLHKEFARTE